MKKSRALALLGLSVAGIGAAMATSQSLNEFTPKVLPVLVQVDRHGTVTALSPSIELSPRFDRLLRQTVDELITKPASDHGHPVASQFVMNLALRTSPRPDGAYDVQFAYVSTSPVPPGSWYWVHVDGYRLALMNRNAARPDRFFHADRGWEHRWVPQGSPRLDSPARGVSHAAAQPLGTAPGRAGK
jgi:hypothetical protein